MYVCMNVHICGCVYIYTHIYTYATPPPDIYLPFHGFAGYVSEHVPQNSGPIQLLMRTCLSLSLSLSLSLCVSLSALAFYRGQA